MYRTPYFMGDDASSRALNGPSMNESLEFWLSPPSAGAFAHSDAYCQPARSF